MLKLVKENFESDLLIVTRDYKIWLIFNFNVLSKNKVIIFDSSCKIDAGGHCCDSYCNQLRRVSFHICTLYALNFGFVN